MEVVQQEEKNTCWAAAFSTLTGIPYDALPLGMSSAPHVFPKRDGGYSLRRTPSYRYGAGSTAVSDWRWTLEGSDFRLRWSRKRPEGKVCIISIVDLLDWGAHAAIVDPDGIVRDSVPSAFDNVHVSELESACNIDIPGYIYLAEKGDAQELESARA